MGSDTDQTESKRDRVRRLLLDPLADHGFRFKRGVTDDDAKSKLAQIADDLAYMSDAGLKAMFQSMRLKGEGSSRDFWPSRAAFLGLAEALEKSPLEEAPALLRWFASVEGPKALQAKTHLAQYLFWSKNKRPPVSVHDWRSVREHADQMADRAMRVQDKLDRGVAPYPDDEAWHRRYLDLDSRVRGYVQDQVKGDAA